MSTQTRRSSVSSSSTSAAKRPAMSENAGKVVPPVPPHQAKKRVVLGNLQNLNNVARQTRNQASTTKAMVSAVTTAKLMAPAGPTVKLTAPAATTVKGKKAPSLYTRSAGLPKSSLPASSAVKTSALASTKPVSGSERLALRVESLLRPCSMDISPSRSDAGSVSMDETMSTCDSLKSSDIEYLDADASAIASIERKANNSFYISEHKQAAASESICKRDLLVEMDTSDEIVNLDNNRDDPQLCATIACDIYKHLRASEHKKRPSTDFMEGVQKDINASMRAILVDWLVEVAEEYRLVPDTLYLTVNYIDRYLSGNVMNRQRLQLLGVACMMIASKYEEICAPQVEEFCYITDNTYFKEEVLQMESAVLNFLKFEMTAPTVKCFLRRFVSAAHGNDEGSSLFLECLANYVGELSLLEYSMLCYPPSLIASSAIFLAKFIMEPAKKPWNSTLRHYTLYKPSELCKCVKELHRLVCNSASSSLPAIREKYSTHKYKFVAKKTCPPSIPSEYFVDLSS